MLPPELNGSSCSQVQSVRDTIVSRWPLISFFSAIISRSKSAIVVWQEFAFFGFNTRVYSIDSKQRKRFELRVNNRRRYSEGYELWATYTIMTGHTFRVAWGSLPSKLENDDDATTSNRLSIVSMVTNTANAVLNFMVDRWMLKGRERERERETCATIIDCEGNWILLQILFLCAVS